MLWAATVVGAGVVIVASSILRQMLASSVIRAGVERAGNPVVAIVFLTWSAYAANADVLCCAWVPIVAIDAITGRVGFRVRGGPSAYATLFTAREARA